MKLRGGITVFLSLTIVCVLSLFLGLLESARTTGARLYARMAADSAAASVMSQYNRNLWDMYHLLFLEAESEKAVEQSFSEYLSYYLEQKNWYSMKSGTVNVTGMTGMMNDGGTWLEQSARDYMIYRLPEAAEDLLGIADDAGNALKVGDFRELFDVCRQTGRKTKKLEAQRRNIENSLRRMRGDLEAIEGAVDAEKKGTFRLAASELRKEIRGFSGLVKRYEEEVQRISDHRLELSEKKKTETAEVSANLSQELLAYEQVEVSAKELLEQYREMNTLMEWNLEQLDMAGEQLEEERYEVVEVDGVSEEVSLGPDWESIAETVSGITILDNEVHEGVDLEKLSLLDQLEELFQGSLLHLVLPVGAEVSKNTVSLNGIPSDIRNRDKKAGKTSLTNAEGSGGTVQDRLLVNEYCMLNFSSFLEAGEANVEHPPLLYEQEYLLCGERSDRENLASAVEKLLAARGAMNLLYLLRSSEKMAEAETLSLAVSGGFAPLTFIMKFFILTLWAFGEAVFDVRQLLNGGRVPFWKNDSQWKLGLEGLLAFQFLDSGSDSYEEGRDYGDHIRILMFLMDREERNYRMMDVIQWNMRTVQEDFAVSDCQYKVELEVLLIEKHRFLLQDTYTRTIRAVGTY